MKKRLKVQRWHLWVTGVIAVLAVAGASVAGLIYFNEHRAFARALQFINQELKNGLELGAEATAITTGMSDDITEVTGWQFEEEWPSYGERQAALVSLKAGLAKAEVLYEEECAESVYDTLVADISQTTDSMRLLGKQRKILNDIKSILEKNLTSGCDNDLASVGIMKFYIDVIEASSHQVEIYDSEYSNNDAIESLGSFVRRYKTKDDVKHIDEIRGLMGEDRFDKYFDSSLALYGTVYDYAKNEDESKFISGYDNIVKAQADATSDSVMFLLYMVQAADREMAKSNEGIIELHKLLLLASQSTTQDTGFNPSVTTTYIVYNAIEDLSSNSSSLPRTASVKDLAEGDLRRRLKNIPGLVYEDMAYASSGKTATLTLTINDEEIELSFSASEQPEIEANESNRV